MGPRQRDALAGLLGAREAGLRGRGRGRRRVAAATEVRLRRGLVAEQAGPLLEVPLLDGGLPLRSAAAAVQLCAGPHGRPAPILAVAHGFGASLVHLNGKGGRLEGRVIGTCRGEGLDPAVDNPTDTLEQATAVQQLGASLLGVAGMGRPGHYSGVQLYDISPLMEEDCGAQVPRASTCAPIATARYPGYCSLFDMSLLRGPSHRFAVVGSLPSNGRTRAVAGFYSFDALSRERSLEPTPLACLGQTHLPSGAATAVTKASSADSCFLGLRDGSLHFVDLRRGFDSEEVSREGCPPRKVARQRFSGGVREGQGAICSLASGDSAASGDIVVGRVDGTVQRLDTRTLQLEELGRIGGIPGARYRAAFSSQASLAAAQGSDGELHLFNTESRTSVCVRRGQARCGASVSAFYRDEMEVVSGVVVGNEAGLHSCSWSELV